jgi:hypothetical protein
MLAIAVVSCIIHTVRGVIANPILLHLQIKLVCETFKKSRSVREHVRT